MPADVYVAPEVEPTDEEVDQKLAQLGRDDILRYIPDGPHREGMRSTLRQILRIELCEKIGDGIVLIELDGKLAQIRPMSDTEWNFDKFHAFMTRVLNACRARIDIAPPD